MPVTTDELIDKAAGAKAASVRARAGVDRSEESRARGDRERDSGARGGDPRRQCTGLRERVAENRDRSPPPDARSRCRHGSGRGGGVATCRSGWRAVRHGHAAERSHYLEKTRAAGRRRRGVRVASQCDERRRGDLPEDRQRRRAARRQRGPREQSRDSRRHSRGTDGRRTA